jgi:hypothetical protein
LLLFYVQFACVPLLQLPGPLPRNKRNSTEVHARPSLRSVRTAKNSLAIHCSLSPGLRPPRPSPRPVGTAENSPAIHCWVSRREACLRPVGTLEPPISRSLFQHRFRPAPRAISHFFDRTTSATCFSRNSLQKNDLSKIRSQINSILKTLQKHHLQNIIANPRFSRCAAFDGKAPERTA